MKWIIGFNYILFTHGIIIVTCDIYHNYVFCESGLASPTENYRLFFGERSPWWLLIKATGAPGHGAKLYDNSALQNLFKSIETIRRFRASQFDLVKAGLKAEGEVISVNMAFLRAGTPSPTVSFFFQGLFILSLVSYLID